MLLVSVFPFHLSFSPHIFIIHASATPNLFYPALSVQNDLTQKTPLLHEGYFTGAS